MRSEHLYSKSFFLIILSSLWFVLFDLTFHGQEVPPASNSKSNTLFEEDIIKQVDLYHPKISSADNERLISSAKRIEKQGAFDPVLSLSSDYLRFNSTTSRGKLKSTTANEIAIDFLTRYGIKVFGGVRLNLGTVKSPLSFTGDSGEYFVGLKIPFFRGARINEKSAAEKQAKLGEPLADAIFSQSRLDVILKAVTSYWDWVGAGKKLDIAKNLLEIAEARAQAIRGRVVLGDLPPIDSIEADQEAERRKGNLVKAERDLQKSLFKLSAYLWEQDSTLSILPDKTQIPLHIPFPTEFTEFQLKDGKTLAIERRPELKILSISREINRVDLDLAKNQRLPVLDFSLSPGRDTGVDSVGSTLKASLTLNWSLRQRTADGKITASQLKIQKINLDEQNERQKILLEVDDIISAINTTYQRYLSASREYQLTKALEKGERDRFVLGDSTLFLVNQRERAAAEAEAKIIDIMVEYKQSVATFKAATVQF